MTTETAVRTLQNLIAGAWVDACATAFDDMPNPATGALLARVPRLPRRPPTAWPRAFGR